MMSTAAETDVPMMPPTRLKVPNFELMAAAVAATTIEVMITILPWSVYSAVEPLLDDGGN